MGFVGVLQTRSMTTKNQLVSGDVINIDIVARKLFPVANCFAGKDVWSSSKLSPARIVSNYNFLWIFYHFTRGCFHGSIISLLACSPQKNCPASSTSNRSYGQRSSFAGFTWNSWIFGFISHIYLKPPECVHVSSSGLGPRVCYIIMS